MLEDTRSLILGAHYKSTQKYKTSNTHLRSLTTKTITNPSIPSGMLNYYFFFF